MFYGAAAFTHSLCGNTWLAANADSSVDKGNMFTNAGTGATISSEICFCDSIKKYYFDNTCSPSCDAGTMRFSTPTVIKKKSGADYTGYTCQVCAAGFYNDQTDATICDDCPLGRYLQDRDRKDPLRHDELEDCEICDINAYQDKIGQPRCIQCPSDKPSIDDFEKPEKHDSEKDCQARAARPLCDNGKGRDENDVCTECLPGSVANNKDVVSGKEKCTLCPVGYFNPNTLKYYTKFKVELKLPPTGGQYINTTLVSKPNRIFFSTIIGDADNNMLAKPSIITAI
jgi:hypothetical protein